MTTLKITFTDYQNIDHSLHFLIFDSSLANRWINIVKKNQAHSEKYINARFTNTTYKNISRVRTKLTNCLTRINRVYDKQLPLYFDMEELTSVELNYLHEEFEVYGDRMQSLIDDKNSGWSKDMHEDFLELNELIHLYEDVLKSKTAEFQNMAALFDYYPQEFHEPILEKDKIWLTPYLKWGDIYLGYNTLGKDWLKVHCDNDIEVIEREQVRPQERFAAEAWINFGPDSGGWWTIYSFEKWVESLPINIRNKVPIDNLNKLCYGRFKIGEIIIDDTFISKYGGSKEGYQQLRSDDKLNWNLTVFSEFKKIKKIEFI